MSIKRTLNLAAGSFIGQGSMLITSIFLLHDSNSNAGAITTALGLIALATLVVDWGGLVTQRQELTLTPNKPINIKNQINSRIPPAFLTAAAISAIYFIEENPLTTILLFATPGIVSQAVNTFGYLDILSKNSSHGLFSGSHYLTASAYILAKALNNETPEPEIIGTAISFSLLLTNFGSTLAAISLSKRKTKQAFSISASRKLIKEGATITTTLIPGQIISRCAAIYLLGLNQDTAAAIYNLSKNLTSIYTQAISISRRGFYSKIYARTTKPTEYKTIFSQQIESNILSFIIIAASSITWVSLEQTTISAAILTILGAHCLAWSISSSYYFKLQITGNNRLQSIHSISCAAITPPLIILGISKSAEGIIILETLISFTTFAFLYLANHQTKQAK